MKTKTASLRASRSDKSGSTSPRVRSVGQAARASEVMPQSQDPAPASIARSVSGQVVEERCGLPLAGVTVRWTMLDATPRSSARPISLGSAATDGDGGFFIEAADDRETQTALCRAQHGGDVRDAKTLLSLVDRRGKILGRPFEVTTRVREIVLHAPTNE